MLQVGTGPSTTLETAVAAAASARVTAYSHCAMQSDAAAGDCCDAEDARHTEAETAATKQHQHAEHGAASAAPQADRRRNEKLSQQVCIARGVAGSCAASK